MFLYESCRLRPMAEADLSQVLKWRNQERVRSNMYTTHEISVAEHQTWFESLDSTRNRYLVFEYEGKPSGLTYFTRIDPDHGRAEWGFYLGPDDLPRGCGTVMGLLSLEMAYGQLELRKVYGEVLDFNQASRKFFERLGFHQDGRLRQHVMKEGKYVDVILFSMMLDEWTESHHGRVLSLIREQSVEVG